MDRGDLHKSADKVRRRLPRRRALLTAVLSAITVVLVNCTAPPILTISELRSLIYDTEDANSWAWKHVSPQFRIVRFKPESDLAIAGAERDLQEVILELSDLSGLEFVMVGPDQIGGADGVFFYENYDPERRDQWFMRALALNREFGSAGLSGIEMRFFKLMEATREAFNQNDPVDKVCEVKKLEIMGTVNKSMGIYDLHASDANSQAFVTCLMRSLLFAIGLRGIDNLRPDEIVIPSEKGYALSPSVRCAVAVLYDEDVEPGTWLSSGTPTMQKALENLEVCR